MSHARERRHHHRYTKRLPLSALRAEGDHEGEDAVETIDLSLGGALCRIGRHLAPMTKIRLRGDLACGAGMHPIDLEAVVVRVDPEEPLPGVTEYRVALFFPSLSEADRKHLENYLIS